MSSRMDAVRIVGAPELRTHSRLEAQRWPPACCTARLPAVSCWRSRPWQPPRRRGARAVNARLVRARVPPGRGAQSPLTYPRCALSPALAASAHSPATPVGLTRPHSTPRQPRSPFPAHSYYLDAGEVDKAHRLGFQHEVAARRIQRQWKLNRNDAAAREAEAAEEELRRAIRLEHIRQRHAAKRLQLALRRRRAWKHYKQRRLAEITATMRGRKAEERTNRFLRELTERVYRRRRAEDEAARVIGRTYRALTVRSRGGTLPGRHPSGCEHTGGWPGSVGVVCLPSRSPSAPRLPGVLTSALRPPCGPALVPAPWHPSRSSPGTGVLHTRRSTNCAGAESAQVATQG
mmetsp:Transcript_14491/g.44172  ORF Transcript_14491/g.44172 Transcript_14491/m.44172 type:complete len:347 (-) Transcript_14491:636-1676(-)